MSWGKALAYMAAAGSRNALRFVSLSVSLGALGGFCFRLILRNGGSSKADSAAIANCAADLY